MSRSIFGPTRVLPSAPPLRPGSRAGVQNQIPHSNLIAPQNQNSSSSSSANVASTVENLVFRLQATLNNSSTDGGVPQGWKEQVQEWGRGAQAELKKLLDHSPPPATTSTQAGDAYAVKHTALPSGGDLLCFEDIPEDNSPCDGEESAFVGGAPSKKTTVVTVESGSNTLPWPRVGDWEGERLVKTLTASRAQAVNDRQNAIQRNHRLLSELNDTRRELARCKDMMDRLQQQQQAVSPQRSAASGAQGPEGAFCGMDGIPVCILLGSQPDSPSSARTTTHASATSSSKSSRSASKMGMGKFADAATQAELIPDFIRDSSSSSANGATTALQCEVDSQKVVITSLENEVNRLRKERDAHHTKQTTDFDNLVKELEETRESLEETTSEWDDKMKELNRLRTLMRFSQLKEDSDKLPALYKRVDELETSVRRYQLSTQRFERDRDEYRRLRLLDAHCRAIADRGGSMDEVPPHLLQPDAINPSKHPQQQMGSRSSNSDGGTAAEPVAASHRPSSSGRPSTAPRSTTQQSSSPQKAATGPSLSSGGINRKELPSLEEKTSPVTKEKEEDVSFSTIAQRMQQYMTKKKEAPPLQPTLSSNSLSQNKRPRPGTAGTLRTPSSSSTSVGGGNGQYTLSKVSSKYMNGVGGSSSTAQSSNTVAGPMRPSSARNLRTSNSDTRPQQQQQQSKGAPTGYSFIAGRLVPFYKMK